MSVLARVAGDPVFLERYELGEHLGTGGMGEVYQGVHRALNRPVAIKFLAADLLQQPQYRERFEAEARIASGLIHSNVVAVFDFGFAAGAPYLVTEFVRGSPLSKILAEREGLRPKEVLAISGQILDGLGAIHKLGIIHRDLKPENLLVIEGDPPVVKIADFGIAKHSSGDTGPKTAMGMVMGTPAYMAPEQAVGDPLGPPTDLYAFAVILYTLVVRRHPFQADSALDLVRKHIHEDPQVPVDMPRPLRELLIRGLAKRPSERYASAAEMKAQLVHVERVVLNSDSWRIGQALNSIPAPRPSNPMAFATMASQSEVMRRSAIAPAPGQGSRQDPTLARPAAERAASQAAPSGAADPGATPSAILRRGGPPPDGPGSAVHKRPNLEADVTASSVHKRPAPAQVGIDVAFTTVVPAAPRRSPRSALWVIGVFALVGVGVVTAHRQGLWPTKVTSESASTARDKRPAPVPTWLQAARARALKEPLAAIETLDYGTAKESPPQPLTLGDPWSTDVDGVLADTLAALTGVQGDKLAATMAAGRKELAGPLGQMLAALGTAIRSGPGPGTDALLATAATLQDPKGNLIGRLPRGNLIERFAVAARATKATTLEELVNQVALMRIAVTRPQLAGHRWMLRFLATAVDPLGVPLVAALAPGAVTKPGPVGRVASEALEKVLTDLDIALYATANRLIRDDASRAKAKKRLLMMEIIAHLDTAAQPGHPTYGSRLVAPTSMPLEIVRENEAISLKVREQVENTLGGSGEIAADLLESSHADELVIRLSKELRCESALMDKDEVDDGLGP